MRADAITSGTVNLMSAIHYYSQFEGPTGFSIAYPVEAQYEDKMWHVFASHRYLFKAAAGFASRSTAPIVFRPGPWEQLRQYPPWMDALEPVIRKEKPTATEEFEFPVQGKQFQK